MHARIPLEVATGTFQALVAGPADGPVVLVLHGFPDIPSNFAALIDELAARGFRVVAPWMRGYAPSVVEGPYDVETLADDVIALADHLSPGRPVHVVGHDWGAAVTYVVCGVAPTRIASAVAISVPHPLAFLRALGRGKQALRSWYMGFFQLPGSERLVAARDFALIDRLWSTWSPRLHLPAARRDELIACLRASWPAPLLYYRAMFRPVGPAVRRLRGTTGVARRITVPLLYLHGAEDGCIGLEASRGAEQYFAGPYREEVIDDAGHFVPAERPREVADRVTAWLRADHR